jgi:hypothetical protein
MKKKEPNRKPNTTCDVCQIPIYRRPNLLIKNKGKHCSTSCRNKIYRYQVIPPIMYGEKNPAWKGGITYKRRKGNYNGVRYVRCPKEYQIMARKDGYITEHRLVMAQHMKRILTRTEVVHHIDHNPSNNKIENLMLFPNNSLHKKYEGLVRRSQLSARYCLAKYPI